MPSGTGRVANRRATPCSADVVGQISSKDPCRPAPAANRAAPATPSTRIESRPRLELAGERRGFGWSTPLVASRLAIVAHALLGHTSDVLGERDGFGAGASVGHDTVGQPEGECFVGVDGPAGEDEVDGPTVTDQSWEADGSAVDEGHAPAPAEHTEGGGLLHDAQVAPECQLETAGDGVAVNGGDDRLAQLHAADAHGAVAGGRDAIACWCPDGFEVGTSAE